MPTTELLQLGASQDIRFLKNVFLCLDIVYELYLSYSVFDSWLVTNFSDRVTFFEWPGHFFCIDLITEF